ncbi:MAG: DUF1642 domain-containing protein [Streptococcus sp.]|nr:DUF1642 domain-containing protein [Streptococcus sp.]
MTVKLPKDIADYLTECKSMNRILGDCFIFKVPLQNLKWFQDHKNQELFAEAWLHGYEIEEEK